MNSFIVFDNNVKIKNKNLKEDIIEIITEIKKGNKKSIKVEEFNLLLNEKLKKKLDLNSRKNKRIFNDFLEENNIMIDIFRGRVYFDSKPRTRNNKYKKNIKLKQLNLNTKESFIEKNYKKKEKEDILKIEDNEENDEEEIIDINLNKKNKNDKKVNMNFMNLYNDIKTVTEEIDSNFEVKNSNDEINTKEKEELLKEIETVFFNPFENKKLSIIIGVVIGIIIAIIAKFI